MNGNMVRRLLYYAKNAATSKSIRKDGVLLTARRTTMWDKIFGPRYEDGIHIHLFLDDHDKDLIKEFRLEADGKIKVCELPEMLRDIADILENIDNDYR